MVVIFDPEGLLTDTDHCRYAAWEQMAHEQGIAYDAALDAQLLLLNRDAQLRAVLQRAHRGYSAAERMALLARQDDLYDEQLEKLGEDAVRPGAGQLLRRLRHQGFLLGAVMTGGLPGRILMRLPLRSFFDAISRKEAFAVQLEDVRLRLCAAAYDCLLATARADSAKTARAQGMQSLLCGYGEEPEAILQQILAMLPENAVQ